MRDWTAEDVRITDLMNRVHAGLYRPTKKEIQRMTERIAQASFASRQVRVDAEARGKPVNGEVLGNKAPSLMAHLGKRIHHDAQWDPRTTAEEYLEDVRTAIRHPEARMVVFTSDDGRRCMGILAPNTVPPERRGDQALAFIWVVYLLDYGTIATGYQVVGLGTIRIPEGERWL